MRGMRGMGILFAAIGFLLSGYYATWQVALLDRGFSLAQLATLLAVANGISISIDVPAGFLADRIGHKISVLAGLVVYALGFMFPAAYAGASGIVLMVILIAVGDALIEGALDSWVADVKVADGHAVTNHSFMGLDQLQRLGMIVGAIVVPGAISLLGNPRQLSWSIYSALAVGVIALAAALPKGIERSATHSGNKPHLSDLVGHLREPTLLILLGGAFLFGMSDGAIQSGFWARTKELGISDPIWLGIIQSSMSLSRVIGLQAWKKSKHVESSKVPAIALIGSSVFFGAFALGLLGKVSILFWMARITVLSAFFAAQRTLVQRLYSESKWRATVASATSTLTQVGVICFSGALGFTKGITASVVCVAGAVLTLMAGVVYLRLAKRIGH